MISQDSAPLSVVLVGSGRMGTALAHEIASDEGFTCVGVYDVDNADDLDTHAPGADLLIDFSHSAALPHIEAYVTRTGAAVVSGTTGLDAADLERLQRLGTKSAVVHAANYSLGVAALRKATALVAAALPDWDIEIVETHHNQKADAPSGTARVLLAALDPDGSRDVIYGREGMMGPRPARQIGMHALRGGTVAGTHEVHLFGTDEEVCLTHRATSRIIFVKGALAAARRLVKRPAGFYTFDELMFEEI